jgi:putative tryptophan/tyrosine transport system substrate-binding protein
MRRREFITLLGGAAAAWPVSARAQQATRVYRIGLLRVGPPPPSFIEPLRRALTDLGYVEGRNLVFDFGIAEGIEQLPGLVADLIRRKADVILASGTPAVLPARNATNTVPVVFVAALDPAATGVVTSLARPGGNVTGLTAVFADLTGKRLEFLKEMLPTLTRVALLSRPANPGHVQYVQQAQMAARMLRVELEVMSATRCRPVIARSLAASRTSIARRGVLSAPHSTQAARNRLTHLCTVRGVTRNSAATEAGARLSSITRLTMRERQWRQVRALV